MTDDERWTEIEVAIVLKLRQYRHEILEDPHVRTVQLQAKFQHRIPGRPGPKPKIERVLYMKESGDDL